MTFDPLSPSVLVGEAISGQAAKARKQLETIIRNVNRSQFDLSDALHDVKKNGFYEGTWTEYLDTLDIKRQRAWYLEKIADVMATVQIARDTYEQVGIAKLRAITSLKPSDTWKNPETGEETPMSEFIIGFVEKHQELSLEELKAHIRVLKGFVGDRDLVYRNLCFMRIVAEQSWDPAIEMAKNHLGSVGKDDEGISIDPSDSAAAEMLAVEFLNIPMNHVLPVEEEG